MQIPLVDLKKQYNYIKKDFDISLDYILKTGSFIKGPVLNEFEYDFAKFIGAKYCIGVASGTDALHLSLMSLGIGQGDEVILPVNTFVATAYAVLYTGAKPVFVDVDIKTYNIDTRSIESKISKKTKVIIPVHLYGQPANMKDILNLSKKYKLFVVEDACQAHGATYAGKKVGIFGDLTAFSFYPSKNLGGFGDGGAITTNSLKLANRIKSLREYGSTSKYTYDKVGINSRLDSIQAAILKIKLQSLQKWNSKKVKLAEYYNEKLKKIPSVITPFTNNELTHVYHLYVIRTKKREALSKYLSLQGIQTGIHYPIPLHLQKSLSFLGYSKGSFPIAESLSEEILSLPVFPELSLKEQNYIIDNIYNFFKKYGN